MKRLFLILATTLALGACALAPQTGSQLTPAQQLLAAQNAHNTACKLWADVYQAAFQLRQAGQASPTLIQQIDILDSQLDNPTAPICTGPLPTDLSTLQSQTTQVMTGVGILEYLTKASKK